ncbi:MAG: hypothetical protein IJ306_01955 [Oscillospiraceae bacterium]|nr:hypothetical protein [Oscillospiraceae bacterium]
MTNFIEELYYNNIDPRENLCKDNRNIKKELYIMSENEDYLLKSLPDEYKKKFLEFVDAAGIVNGETNLNNFIAGFRLGACFAIDTFCEKKLSVDNYLKEK